VGWVGGSSWLELAVEGAAHHEAEERWTDACRGFSQAPWQQAGEMFEVRLA